MQQQVTNIVHKDLGGDGGLLVAEPEEKCKQGKVRSYTEPTSQLCPGVVYHAEVPSFFLHLFKIPPPLKISWKVVFSGLTAKL